jgi:PAS domain S-box-containing protein
MARPYPASDCPVLRACRTGQNCHVENDVLWRKDGTAFAAAYAAFPLQPENSQQGSPLLPGRGAVMTFRDISARKAVEAALRESEARKGAILAAALDSILSIDEAGRVIEFNPAAESTFGYKRDEALGQEMAQLIIPPSLRDAHRAGLAHYRKTGEGPLLNQRIEVPALRRDGTEFPAELAITPVSLGPDRPFFTAYLRDISEQKALEARVQVAYAREKRIAQTFQEQLLPIIPPDAFRGLTVATRYQVAWREAQVGGDFYDGLMLPDGRVAFVVGDVSGKGLKAATHTAEIRHSLRALLHVCGGDPAWAVARLNDLLSAAPAKQPAGERDNKDPVGYFTAMALAVINPRSGETQFVVAGGEPPLVLRQGGGSPEVIETIQEGGLLLGIEPGMQYPTGQATLFPGDALLMVTDGITEARRGADLLGPEGLVRLVNDAAATAGATTDHLAEAIVTGARAFGNGSLHDDVCLLVARRRPLSS